MTIRLGIFIVHLAHIFSAQPVRNESPMVDYSTKKITKELIEEIRAALKNVRGWGSVEIYVQDFKVTQITERNIKKTSHSIKNL